MNRNLVFLCLFIFISCSDKKNETPQNNVPEALQDNNKKSGVVRLSKGGREDLVDALYNENLEKSPGLVAIDKLYNDLKENKSDSLDAFNDYDEKNGQYYNSANSHLRQIRDSLLKKEIQTILTNSLDQFNSKAARLNSLKDALNRADVAADDRYEAVKLLVSLRMIELYQDNLPSSRSIESIISDYDRLNKKLDSVIVKNK